MQLLTFLLSKLTIPVTLATSAVGPYLQTVEALTLKSTSEEAVPTALSTSPLNSFFFSPLLVYGAIVIFFLVFILLVVLQIARHIVDLRKITASLVVALIVAVIPLSVRLILEANKLEIRASPDEIPRSIMVTQLTNTSLRITWMTNASKTGLVRVSQAPLDPEHAQVVIADFGNKVKEHTVLLKNLQPGVAYELEILSGGKWYNIEGTPLRFVLDQ
ncbi:TPA: hypothetical protein DIV55_05020 [Patescibacteria group bacterium]|uniref:Fibronectin type-III domain-containing protein n=1 Tax=Candidatus Gottesmanbacteria bacterium GW2011_GWA1_43_11 TaxID=1618436 RepID=A0A0G1CIV3_9BACT|nr:MAG: hypothetical protein UV59_C0007G0005 [Candidatus Gottesmanbacteria bacterium GW2011_GWA1_43_11]HCS79070.1 hypothetical protein [Patescibacteria group bacterium]